jgi:uncharacterized protein DUF4175
MTDRYQDLRVFIAHVRRRWFAQELLRTAAFGAAAASVPVAVAVAVDRIVHPSGTLLVSIAALTAGVSVLLVGVAAWCMQRRPDDRRVARFIEEAADAAPGARPLEDAVVTAVAVQNDEAGGFRPLIVDAALKRLEGLAPWDIVPPAAIRGVALRAVAAFAALGLVMVLGARPLLQAIDTARLALLPDSLRIVVQPGDLRVPAGKPVHIKATVQGAGRALAGVGATLIVSAGSEQRTVAMARAGDAFEFPFASVDRTFRYHVSVGSRSSREYTVTALFPPRVRRIDVHYEYPKFAGLQPRDERDGGDVYAPAGTRVRLRIETDKPTVSGAIAFGGSTPGQALQSVTGTTLETELVLARDDSYRLRLTDADGLSADGDTEYFIRLMDDRPPDVRVMRPASDQQITSLEEVAIEARADDDYGVAQFDLVYGVAGRAERVVPFARVSGSNVAKVGALMLAAEDLHVQPGDVITYYARARDIARGKPSTETRSDMFFLEVRPFNEEFVAAQSQAAGGGDPQLESLISAQKEVINATWNIERRANAGRSSADIASVAEAQAQVKARAEQMSGGRGPGSVQFPQQVAPFDQPRARRQNADVVTAAIEAMGHAVQELRGEKTKDALPHEMAALQALLQAQAEIRRRQIAQGNGASGGGSGRQGQDLSSLFDKELQRQQRTNYETRSQIEERPDQKDDSSALDRIRDLAKRQEDLSRQQRELAQSQLSAEEMKRQLDKLTREQTELREQVEQLGKEMSGQQQGAAAKSQASDRSSSSSSAGRTSGDMRQASEQMRSAASDLRRQDPTSAAESSRRAADQLRRLEQQMGGGSADARQRIAGELQLEARQIADAQRGIAAESERLQKEGGATPDALRRLAGEKESLADRVDTLKKAAESLAGRSGAGKGKEAAKDTAAATGAAEGAREIERQQLAPRMRDAAKQMRAEAAQPAHNTSRTGDAARARTEQQLADAADKVAEKLGGSATTDARRMSEDLDASRAIRDRLDRLERQMRAAEAQARAGRAGETAPGSDGRQGQRGRDGSGGSGSGGELQRMREEYARELQRAREELSRLQQGAQRDANGGSTPEQHEWSLSAPGTEAFKQDFSKWESLRKDIDRSLERYDSDVSQRLANKLSEDRLNAGGSDRVPDGYARLIARYYESLAKTKN